MTTSAAKYTRTLVVITLYTLHMFMYVHDAYSSYSRTSLFLVNSPSWLPCGGAGGSVNAMLRFLDGIFFAVVIVYIFQSLGLLMGASLLGFSFCMSVMDVVIPSYFCRQFPALLITIVLKGEGETLTAMLIDRQCNSDCCAKCPRRTDTHTLSRPTNQHS